MKPRPVVLLAVVAATLALATWAAPRKQGLSALDWAAKAAGDVPPVAVLIEFGVKDTQPTPCSGRAKVEGAAVIHREGYRFRNTDKLVGPDAWEASSHRPMRPGVAANAARPEPIATVGVVLHLGDPKPDATLTVEPKDQEFERFTVPLADVLAGKPVPVAGGKAVVRRITVATPVAATQAEEDFPAAAYSPDGTLWVAYISYTLKDESQRVQQSPLKEQQADFRDYYKPEFGDQLFVRSYRNGKWGEPIAVTGPKEDLVRCAVAADHDGTVWLAYSARRGGTDSLFVRPLIKAEGRAGYAPGPEKKVSQNDGPCLGPVMVTDAKTGLYLAGQAWGPKGAFAVSATRLQGGNPTTQQTIGDRAGENQWHPAVAASPDGKLALAYDVYRDGDYDVELLVSGDGTPARHTIASSSRFEARPSIAYDAKGRLWIAYEEGPELWGKDSGALAKVGNPLYSDRSVRVVCLDTDGTLKRPAAELGRSAVGNPGAQTGPEVVQQNERATRYAHPQIGIDGKGRVWLTYRQNFGTRATTTIGNYFLTFARRLDGDHWSEPIEVHHSDGLLDSRPALLPHPAGGLVIVHNTDGRFTAPQAIGNQVFMSVIDLPGDPVEPKLVSHDVGRKDPESLKVTAAERAAVKRMRDHRINVGGKTYRPLRGEFHRHTDISFDGAADGSLEDMFRYAIDAAAMDWIGNGDHDNGGGREYSWWLTQKLTDAYFVKDTFTPMFTYERSVSYPMGHRNCMFARRGVRTLPRLAPPARGQGVAGVNLDDTKMLYRYLKELDGICASHTSATSMGTDWRDNDAKVEPVVEIYQGDRMSYESEGAPRAGYDPKTGQKPANIAGWYPAGYIDNALREKGYRLGFQSSSDHWSTHISYCIPLAERHDRAAILDAMKQRHCYGATDNIVLDVRCAGHVMGDEFKTGDAPAIELNVVGTGPVARVDVLKDSRVVATLTPGTPECKGNWTDPQPSNGVHYYYVRVEQADGQLAWASPIWVDYAK